MKRSLHFRGIGIKLRLLDSENQPCNEWHQGLERIDLPGPGADAIYLTASHCPSYVSLR